MINTVNEPPLYFLDEFQATISVALLKNIDYDVFQNQGFISLYDRLVCMTKKRDETKKIEIPQDKVVDEFTRLPVFKM